MGPGSYWLQSLEVQGAQPHQEERLPGSRPNTAARQWPFGGDGSRETWAITSRGRPLGLKELRTGHMAPPLGTALGEERAWRALTFMAWLGLWVQALTPPGSGGRLWAPSASTQPGLHLGWGTLKMTGPQPLQGWLQPLVATETQVRGIGPMPGPSPPERGVWAL